MREALLYGKEDVRIIDVEIPVIGPDDLLVKVRAAKICPTDVRKYTLGAEDTRIRSLPMNLCHEYAGEIVQVGDNVKAYKKGMRVTGYGMKGNAEYVKLTANDTNLYFKNAIQEIPSNVSYEAASFTTPLSECMHSVVDQAQLRFGETIVIVGAGHMGIQQANIAHWCGAQVIVTDMVDQRLEVAKALGADYVINISKTDVESEVNQITDGEMADCAIATLGIPPVIQSAINLVGHNGRIVLFGGSPTGTIMQFNPNDIHYSEKHLIGIEGIGVGNNRHLERRSHALRHIARGKIDLDRMITRVMPMTDIVDAYEQIRKGEALSIVLDPSK